MPAIRVVVAALRPFWPNASLSSVNRVSKGPNRFAIAGERPRVHTTARAVAVSNKVFIFDLARVDATISSSQSTRLGRSGERRLPPMAVGIDRRHADKDPRASYFIPILLTDVARP